MVSRRSFHEQLEDLQHNLLRMGTFVNESIQKAVQSLATLDGELAREVIAGDDTVDRMLIELQERSLQLLALQQPMAGDLRAVGTVLKIVTDLERIADHATDIADVTIRLEGDHLFKPLIDISRMTELVQVMTQEALQAYVHRDVARARRMIALDDDVDKIYATIFEELMGIMQTKPEHVKQATYLLMVAMYLERIGDHATNVGEWTIYLVTGKLQDLNH